MSFRRNIPFNWRPSLGNVKTEVAVYKNFHWLPIPKPPVLRRVMEVSDDFGIYFCLYRVVVIGRDLRKRLTNGMRNTRMVIELNDSRVNFLVVALGLSGVDRMVGRVRIRSTALPILVSRLGFAVLAFLFAHCETRQTFVHEIALSLLVCLAFLKLKLTFRCTGLPVSKFDWCEGN